MDNVVPFVKWVGGKRQLLDKLESFLPEKINKYYEPFVGGGALLFHCKFEKVIINDLNFELITTYNVIKNNPKLLMQKLEELNKEHLNNPEKHYFKIRSLDREYKISDMDEIDIAARFIYLNKYCFNGLYRVNSKNQFNVPWNKKEHVVLYNKKNIMKISEYLKNISINNEDFEKVLKDVSKGDLVYFDPPYDLLKKDTFDSYNKDSFGVEGQKRLAKIYAELDKKGAYLILSNHNTELIQKLYKGYNFYEVEVNRMINSNAQKRGKEKIEVIITNFKKESNE